MAAPQPHPLLAVGWWDYGIFSSHGGLQERQRHRKRLGPAATAKGSGSLGCGFFVGKKSRNSLAGINKCRISPLPFHLPVRCHNLTFNGTREESDELVSTGKGEERGEKGAESQ